MLLILYTCHRNHCISYSPVPSKAPTNKPAQGIEKAAEKAAIEVAAAEHVRQEKERMLVNAESSNTDKQPNNDTDTNFDDDFGGDEITDLEYTGNAAEAAEAKTATSTISTPTARRSKVWVFFYWLFLVYGTGYDHWSLNYFHCRRIY